MQDGRKALSLQASESSPDAALVPFRELKGANIQDLIICYCSVSLGDQRKDVAWKPHWYYDSENLENFQKQDPQAKTMEIFM